MFMRISDDTFQEKICGDHGCGTGGSSPSARDLVSDNLPHPSRSLQPRARHNSNYDELLGLGWWVPRCAAGWCLHCEKSSWEVLAMRSVRETAKQKWKTPHDELAKPGIRFRVGFRKR